MEKRLHFLLLATRFPQTKMDLNESVPPGMPKKSAVVAGLPNYKYQGVYLDNKLNWYLNTKRGRAASFSSNSDLLHM